MNRTQTTAIDLMAAVHVIRAQGWCQRLMCDHAGRVCAMGAISAAVYRYGEHSDRTDDRVARAARAMDAVCGRPVSVFNDLPTTTEEDVVELLELAARSV